MLMAKKKPQNNKLSDKSKEEVPTVSITAKLKLLPDKEIAARLEETRKIYSAACNYVSVYVFENKRLSYDTVNKAMYRDIIALYGLKAQMAQSVSKTVIARYKSAKTNGHEWTLIKFKHPECDLVWNHDYSLKGDMLSIGTLEGRVKIKFHNEGMEHFFDGNNKWKYGTAKLVYKHGYWFLHISMTKDVKDIKDGEITGVAGVDLGMNFLATSYDKDGKTEFFNGKHVKHKKAKHKKVRQQLQKRGTPSARRRLKAIGQRENRWMRDVNHCVSKALVNSQPANTLFVLEDLTGIRSATEMVKVKDRAVHVGWAFYQLRLMIEYKAQLAESKSIAVCPKYTSQTCPLCGHVEASNRNKKTHTFRCKKCGYTCNDDRAAAMNLYSKGIKHLAEQTA
jgi:IS605 OrfB family transposase